MSTATATAARAAKKAAAKPAGLKQARVTKKAAGKKAPAAAAATASHDSPKKAAALVAKKKKAGAPVVKPVREGRPVDWIAEHAMKTFNLRAAIGTASHLTYKAIRDCIDANVDEAVDKALKFMEHGRRRMLGPEDAVHAYARMGQKIYGFSQ